MHLFSIAGFSRLLLDFSQQQKSWSSFPILTSTQSDMKRIEACCGYCCLDNTKAELQIPGLCHCQLLACCVSPPGLCQESNTRLPCWTVTWCREICWFFTAGTRPVASLAVYTPFVSVSGNCVSFCFAEAAARVLGKELLQQDQGSQSRWAVGCS